jgi:hypothetical protein
MAYYTFTSGRSLGQPRNSKHGQRSRLRRDAWGGNCRANQFGRRTRLALRLTLGLRLHFASPLLGRRLATDLSTCTGTTVALELMYKYPGGVAAMKPSKFPTSVYPGH